MCSTKNNFIHMVVRVLGVLLIFLFFMNLRHNKLKLLNMRKIITLLISIFWVSQFLSAQNIRYQDEIFSNVVKIDNHIYSINIIVVTGAPALDTVRYDACIRAH